MNIIYAPVIYFLPYKCIGFTISLHNIDARHYDMHGIVTTRVIVSGLISVQTQRYIDFDICF